MDKEKFQSIRFWTPLKGDTQHYFNVDQIVSVSEILVGRMF
jgi:hypothetical protein